MSLRKYLELFRQALEKLENYGYTESIEIKEEIRPNKQAIIKAKTVFINRSVPMLPGPICPYTLRTGWNRFWALPAVWRSFTRVTCKLPLPLCWCGGGKPCLMRWLPVLYCCLMESVFGCSTDWKGRRCLLRAYRICLVCAIHPGWRTDGSGCFCICCPRQCGRYRLHQTWRVFGKTATMQ